MKSIPTFSAMLILSVVIFLHLPTPIHGQELPQDPAGESPLGIRQQRIKRLIEELGQRFEEIAKKIEKDSGEDAERLRAGVREMQERLLTQRVDEVIELLNRANLDSATEEQAALIGDVSSLLTLLLQDEDEAARRERELKELKEWQEKLRGMIDEQKKAIDDTETTADIEEARKLAQENAEQAGELLQEQKLLKEKAQNAEANLDQMDQMKGEQQELREKTDELAEKLQNEADGGEESPKPGAKELKEAAKDQENAEKNFEKQNKSEAEQSQDSAIKDLQAAKEALEAEQKRLEEMNPEERNEELAGEQNESAQKASDLSQEMAQSEQAQEGESADAIEKAMENLKNAQEKMKGSSEKLAQQKPQDAKPDQNDALENLEKAEKELAQEIEKREQEKKMEQMAQLEQVFREMLERQNAVTKATQKLDQTRQERENQRLLRAERIEMRNGADEEAALAKIADETATTLDESDESVVFRDIVRDLADSLRSAGELMANAETGAITQRSHAEIELTLEELIAALEAAQSNPQAGKPQPTPEQMAQMKQMMLPPSAELKLLKLSQLRVNRRTRDVSDAIGDNPEIDAALGNRLRELADFQRSLGVMALEIGTRIKAMEEDID